MSVCVETGLMERPSFRDDFVKRRAAEIALPEIRAWCGADSNDEDIIYSLMKVANEFSNGFQFAKSLEDRCGWSSADSFLVDLLDNGWCKQALEELTAQWVKCLGIVPQFSIGDRVRWRRKFREERFGIVTRIFADQAKYGVRFDGMEESTYGVILFEHCEKAEVGQ